MNLENSHERMLVGGGLFALVISLGALSATLCASAIDHMAFAASLCLPTSGHCLLCVGAGISLVATLATGLAGASLFWRGSPAQPAV